MVKKMVGLCGLNKHKIMGLIENELKWVKDQDLSRIFKALSCFFYPLDRAHPLPPHVNFSQQKEKASTRKIREKNQEENLEEKYGESRGS